MESILLLRAQQVEARCWFINHNSINLNQFNSSKSLQKSMLLLSILNYRGKYLNTNKEIVAMCTGQLDPTKTNDFLFIGSKTNLLAYGTSSWLITCRCGKQSWHLWQRGFRWSELSFIWKIRWSYRATSYRSWWQLFNNWLRSIIWWTVLDCNWGQCLNFGVSGLGWWRWRRDGCWIGRFFN